MSAPRPPAGLRTAGRRLWRAVTGSFELEEHELTLLRQAARVADVCDDLHAAVEADGPLLNGRAHPGLVELRAQRVLLARLIVALRVPLAEDDGVGATRAAAGYRTQRRGVRGVYAIKGGRS